MNLQLVYWYILSLSKNENMFNKKKNKKQNKTKRTKKRRKKKFPAVEVESVSRLIKIIHAHNLHVKCWTLFHLQFVRKGTQIAY